jgi:hypothetical protein
MMPPTIVVAAIPTVVVAATAVMAPPMPMPMPVSAFDLNDCPIDAAQRIGCCCGHSRCRHGWCECKRTAGKSDYQKPFHLSASSFVALRIISSVFAMLAERCIHRPFRTVATDSWNSAASWNLVVSVLMEVVRLPRWVLVRGRLHVSACGAVGRVLGCYIAKQATCRRAATLSAAGPFRCRARVWSTDC